MGSDIADFYDICELRVTPLRGMIYGMRRLSRMGRPPFRKRCPANIKYTHNELDNGYRRLGNDEKDEVGWLKNELHKRGYEFTKKSFAYNGTELIDDERESRGTVYIVESAREKEMKRIPPERNALRAGDAMRDILRSSSGRGIRHVRAFEAG